MDPTLIERARGGDASAMESLLLEVSPTVERFVRRLCPGPEGDDVMQDTLLAITMHLDQYEGRASFSSWVYAVARGACSHQRRGLKNRPHEGDDSIVSLADPSPDPEQAVTHEELSRSLTRALDSLTAEHRDVIRLRDVEGATAPDVARALGISVDAVKSRLHRARAALRDALRPTLEAHAPPPDARCPDVMALWSTRLEGDLAPSDCAAMEQHLTGCLSCGSACDALKRALWACQSSRTSVVTPQTRDRVRAAIVAWGEAREPSRSPGGSHEARKV